MDKKNTVIGLVLIVAAIVLMSLQAPSPPPPEQLPPVGGSGRETQEGPRQGDEPEPEPGFVTGGGGDEPGEGAPALTEPVEARAPSPIAPEEGAAEASEERYVLENDFIRVTFTSRGGAIEEIALIAEEGGGLKYPRLPDGEEPVIYNRDGPLPALALSIAGSDGLPREYAPLYRMTERGDHSIVFQLQTREGLLVQRGYWITAPGAEGEPYLITHRTRFINQGERAQSLKNLYINLGTVPPTPGDTRSEYLNFGYYRDGDIDFIRSTRFTGGGGFLGIGASEPVPFVRKELNNVRWASLKNQFFAGLLTPTPDEDGQVPTTGIYAEPVELELNSEIYGDRQVAVTGSLAFDLGEIGTLEGSREKAFQADFFVGPKEYQRLAGLGQEQDKVMQFGWLSSISIILLFMLQGIESFVPNWGLAIILLTVVVKTVLWPLTAVQVRSARRMQKLSEPMKALKEKYQDNPQKMQQETMKLFKEHKVNPAAGCLPLLVQMPIFIGLFFMLRTASELRYAEFLWISDLASSDTVARIAGFPLNILPLIMGVTMFLQMRMMPTPSADNMQRKLFQFMPAIFLVFLYNFPAGLVLYWTTQNLLTMFQTWVMRRGQDDEPAPAAAAGGKPAAGPKPAGTGKTAGAKKAVKKRAAAGKKKKK